MATHRLDADHRTLHGTFSPDRTPVLEVEPGDTVVLTTLDSGWSTAPWAGGPEAAWRRHPAWREGFGHALTGPIAVRGAERGDTLEVRVVDVVPGGYGTTFAGRHATPYNVAYGLTAADRAVLTWTLDAAAGRGVNQHGHAVALRPFLGVLGMPPPEPGDHSTIPPRAWGGNLDCRELVAGSTLYLPVPVTGALLSVGDGHARQGDGEVSGTAIECPMARVELRLDVRRDLPVEGPVARTPDGAWLTMGLGATLDEAAYRALTGMFALIADRFGLTRAEAVALASISPSLRPGGAPSRRARDAAREPGGRRARRAARRRGGAFRTRMIAASTQGGAFKPYGSRQRDRRLLVRGSGPTRSAPARTVS